MKIARYSLVYETILKASAASSIYLRAKFLRESRLYKLRPDRKMGSERSALLQSNDRTTAREGLNAEELRNSLRTATL